MRHRILFVLALLLTASAHAQDRPTPHSGSRTFYDAQGRISGTGSTSGAVATFRDASGRMIGTAERMPDGRMEFRDSMGRLTGTSSK